MIKMVFFGTIVFSAIWIAAFTICLIVIYQVQDISAPYVMLNIWQLPFFALIYILIAIRALQRKPRIEITWLPIQYFFVICNTLLATAFSKYLYIAEHHIGGRHGKNLQRDEQHSNHR